MTSMRTLTLVALAAGLLTGCGSTGKDAAPLAAPPVAGTPAKPAPPASPAAPAPDSKLVSLPFRVDVSFTEGARDALRAANADLGIAADYYGPPKDPSLPGLDPDLGVWLGGEMETIHSGERSVTFRGQVDAARVAREVQGDARVKVTVFPVRASTAEAPVTCSEFDEYLSIAVETGGTVHCTLKDE